MSFCQTITYIGISIALLTMSCGKDNTEQPLAEEQPPAESNIVELSDAQVKTAGIVLGKIEDRQISGTIKVNGVLDVPPQQLVSISVPIGGFLKSTDLLEGSRVKKGQVLATIENVDFIQIQQDYLEAKGNLELAKADYERQQELAKENVNSQKTLQQSKTVFTTWQAKYSGLLEKLKVLNMNVASIEGGNLRSSINLYSPIDGYVTEVNVNIGKFVNPTDVLFEIVDTEHLHAELIIFEKDVPRLRIGQKVRFTLANETKDRTATIHLIGREISTDRTIQVHCHIDQEDKELLPGMYLKAQVETGGTSGPAVPDEAVIDFQGSKNLFVVTSVTPEKGTHFEMIEIQVGNSEMGYTEVILPEGFSKEKQIAVKGAYALISKLKNTEEE